MLYQLPNGYTVEMSVDQFLHLSDADVQFLIAGRHGAEHNDPFYGSALRKMRTAPPDEQLNADDELDLAELIPSDQAELASVAGLQAIYDDGDYFPEED